MDPVKALVYRAIDKCKQLGAQRGRSNRSKKKNGWKYVEKKKIDDKNYYENNKAAVAKTLKAYREKHKVKRNKQIKEINKARRKNDPVYRAACQCRTRIGNFLRSNNILKKGKTFDQIGCTPPELAAHLGISRNSDLDRWKHIDHIFPLTMYGLTSKEQQCKAMHYSNLQVLTESENESKHGRLPTKAMAAKVNIDCWPAGVSWEDLPDVYQGWSTGLKM